VEVVGDEVRITTKKKIMGDLVETVKILVFNPKFQLPLLHRKHPKTY
jgi:hypothetical protein